MSTDQLLNPLLRRYELIPKHAPSGFGTLMDLTLNEALEVLQAALYDPLAAEQTNPSLWGYRDGTVYRFLCNGLTPAAWHGYLKALVPPAALATLSRLPSVRFVQPPERAVPETGRSSLLAAKRYRAPEHRLFHRDAGYLEGRRVRRSRETRAMANRTSFGREAIAGQWASAEFAALSRLWEEGAAVPYPVQLLGTELMLEFIGDPDGTAAPRLAPGS